MERAQNNLVSIAEANSPGDSKSPGEFARLFCARSYAQFMIDFPGFKNLESLAACLPALA